MSVDGAAVFAARLTQWQQWQQAPWGRIRYAVAAANLARHVPAGRVLRVLDVGGGNGGDALGLAASGHHVTVLDSSPAMLADAEKEFAAAGLADLLSTECGDATEMVVGGEYDLVLCHALLPYVEDPQGLLTRCVRAVRPGGLLSVLSGNADAQPLRLAVRELDLAGARAAIGAGLRRTEVFDTDFRQYTPTEVMRMLELLHANVAGFYGIRSVCDLITDEDRKAEPGFFAELLELELALAARMPYPWTAGLFHLIASPSAA